MIPKADLLANPPVITNRIFFGVTNYATRGAVLQPVTCLDGSSRGNILAAGSLGRRFSVPLQSRGYHRAPVPAPPTPRSRRRPTSGLMPTPPRSTRRNLTGRPRSPTTTRGSAPGFTPSAVSFLPFTILKWTGAPRSGGIASTPPTTPCWNPAPSPIPNLDLFYPSIAANTNGVVVIGCNGCSLNTYISSYAFAGVTADGVTTFGGSILLASSSVNYHDLNEQFGFADESRWGDYSTVSVDPSDPARFWTIQMLAPLRRPVG